MNVPDLTDSKFFQKTLTLYSAVIICDCARSGITPVRKGLFVLLSYTVEKYIQKKERDKW
ncbi:hypothetical protein BN1200_840017 [Klebsiella variicola]|nr:hypothetical protein BN1200_840017 [Klebsiella variicola]